MRLLFPYSGINWDLNPTGHTEWKGEVVHFCESCPIYNQLLSNGLKAYICFNFGTHGPWLGDELEGCDRWKMQRSRQGVGAARSEAVRSRERASPADLHCQDERLLSVGAEASNSRLLLHPFSHPPVLPPFLSVTLLTLTTIWYSSAASRLPGCHGYPMPRVSQQDNPRRHSQITWIQLASRLCFPHTDLIYLFPRSSVRIQIICNIIEMEEA